MAEFFQKPVRGQWRHQGYPEMITVDGVRFRRAKLWLPYPNVVAQYREDRPLASQHLMVHPNGTWSIDHVDEVNPDKGILSALLHLVVDAIPAWLTKFVHALANAIQRGLMALGEGMVALLGQMRTLGYDG